MTLGSILTAEPIEILSLIGGDFVMGNKLGKCAPKGHFTCRVCKEVSPYTQDRNLVVCPYCLKIVKPCNCGCGEMIPKYLDGGSVRKYKNKTHWNNHQWSDPTHRKAMGKLSKERWKVPEYIEFFRQMKKRHWQDPEYRQLMVESGKAQWQDPEYREYMAECIAKWRLTPEGKEHAYQFGAQVDPELCRQNTIKQWQDPEIRASMVAGIIEWHADPTNKESHKQSCSDGWTEEARLRVSGANRHNWKGGVELWYGPNWAIQSEKARQRDSVCQYCGKTPDENGYALSVHHIIPFRFFGTDNYKLANTIENLICYCISCHVNCPSHWMSIDELSRALRDGDTLPGPFGISIPIEIT